MRCKISTEKVTTNRTQGGIHNQTRAGINMIFWMIPLDVIVRMKRRNSEAQTYEQYKKRAGMYVYVSQLHSIDTQN